MIHLHVARWLSAANLQAYARARIAGATSRGSAIVVARGPYAGAIVRTWGRRLTILATIPTLRGMLWMLTPIGWCRWFFRDRHIAREIANELAEQFEKELGAK